MAQTDQAAPSERILRTEFLGRQKSVSLGIILPEITLPGILNSLTDIESCSLSISVTRNTATRRITSAPNGQFGVTYGRMGEAIPASIKHVAREILDQNKLCEIEADHVSLSISDFSQAQRSAGFCDAYKVDQEQYSRSKQYLEEVIQETAASGHSNYYTIDTVDLIHDNADNLKKESLEKHFEQISTPTQRRTLLRHYTSKPSRITKLSGKGTRSLKLSEADVMRMTLKFWDSLNWAQRIFNLVKKEQVGRPCGIEIALQESLKATTDKELLFYLGELKRRKVTVDFIAPHLGLQPYKDLRGDAAKKFKTNLENQAAIARHVSESLISVVAKPGKALDNLHGPSFFKTILDSTDGNVRVKVPDSYFEIILFILSQLPQRSVGYNVYSRIFDGVERHLKKNLNQINNLISEQLKNLIQQYNEDIKALKIKPRDPQAEFFRRYCMISMNLRDTQGIRYLREALLELYQTDKPISCKNQPGDFSIYRETDEVHEKVIGFSLNWLRAQFFPYLTSFNLLTLRVPILRNLLCHT